MYPFQRFDENGFRIIVKPTIHYNTQGCIKNSKSIDITYNFSHPART